MLFILTLIGIVVFVLFGAWFNDQPSYTQDNVFKVFGYILLSIASIAFGIFVFIVS